MNNVIEFHDKPHYEWSACETCGCDRFRIKVRLPEYIIEGFECPGCGLYEPLEYSGD